MSTGAYDRLAANGIIDFDADAYIKGTTPRYVGDPDGYVGLPYDRPLPVMNQPMGPYPGAHNRPQLHAQPNKDAFVTHSDKKRTNIHWKEALFGVLLAAAGVFGGIKLSRAIKNRRAAKAAAATATTTTTTTAGATSRNKFSFKNILSKVKALGPIIKAKWTAMPKLGKIATGSAAGLALLYGIFKITTKKATPQAPPVHN